MQAISRERCTLHANREAVARCPECQRFFCRECITEHEGRVVCSQCLEKIVLASSPQRAASSEFRAISKKFKKGALITLQLFIGIALTWGFFYYMGQYMIEIPSAFHEGTIWESIEEGLQ
ncbi:MAG: hypothetical protein JEZ02_15910 [Desulfatibacillum sp.]|nr:hypothetical protein [Desulfatibacillum sp.]